MIEEEKKIIRREKHPGRAAQGPKLAALIKRRKEEILHNKKQSKEQQDSTTAFLASAQPTEQPSVQSDDTYVYGIGILAVFAIGVCVFCTYNASQTKNRKTVNEKKQDQKPKRRIYFRKNIQ